MLQVQLEIHVFQLSEEGPADDDEPEDDVSTYRDWLLLDIRGRHQVPPPAVRIYCEPRLLVTDALLSHGRSAASVLGHVDSFYMHTCLGNSIACAFAGR